MYRILLFFLFLICCDQTSFSQKVSGTLTDENHNALPYGWIYLKDSKIGSRSDDTGTYELDASKLRFPILDTIVINYFGYKPYRKAIYLTGIDQILEITLRNDFQLIESVTVKALPKLAPEEVIKNAIKNRKKNYVNKHTLSHGFYREVVKENGEWIVLNEAVINLKYSPYPQKRFLNHAMKAYYKKDVLPWDLFSGAIFKHMHRFTSFIPVKKDQVEIVSSRTSINHTIYDIETSPAGGPGNVIKLSIFQNVSF